MAMSLSVSGVCRHLHRNAVKGPGVDRYGPMGPIRGPNGRWHRPFGRGIALPSPVSHMAVSGPSRPGLPDWHRNLSCATADCVVAIRGPPRWPPNCKDSVCRTTSRPSRGRWIELEFQRPSSWPWVWSPWFPCSSSGSSSTVSTTRMPSGTSCPGRTCGDSRQVVTKDPFSEFSTNQWVQIDWLSDLVMAGAYSAGGLAGVAWLYAVLDVVLFVALYAGMPGAGGNPGVCHRGVRRWLRNLREPRSAPRRSRSSCLQ